MTGGAASAAVPAASSHPPGAGAPAARAASDLLPRRPYPGLRPFEKAEWPILRGRDRLIQDILAVLAENHFASIIGPSGSGKSSLVRAGVLATLERRHSRMGVRWRTGTMRPGVAPLWSMAEGILRSLRPELVAHDGELPAAEVARLRVLLDTSDDGLAVLTRTFPLEEHENFRCWSISSRRSSGTAPTRTIASAPGWSSCWWRWPTTARPASTLSPRCARSTSATARASPAWRRPSTRPIPAAEDDRGGAPPGDRRAGRA